MNDESPSSPDLDALLADYLDGVVDRDELLRRYPQHRDAIIEFLSDYERYAKRLSPLGSTSPRAPSWVGKRFGDYEVISEIARGGMGVVYRALHAPLCREVALKMILSGPLATEEELRRFRVEVTAAAALDHPGIVPIHEVGEHEGYHYFSMALVDGEPIDERVRAQRSGEREICRLVRDAARAVHHAHDRGVLHRDIKPANVLVDRDGRVQVTDFSLAKQTGIEGDSTLSGFVVGTPSYVPPEYLVAAERRATVAGEVYSLGALLYECLLGRPPFAGDSTLDILVRVRDEEPARPRFLRPGLPVDLETVCLKALDKDPGRRYATAAELAEDLDRYLEGRPVIARRGSSWLRLRKWVARRPAIAALIALAAILAVTIIAGSVIYGRRMAGMLETSRTMAEERRRALYVASTNLMEAASRLGRWERLQSLLAEETGVAGGPELRGFERYYFRRLANGHVRLPVPHALSECRSLAFDPRGRFVAMGERESEERRTPAVSIVDTRAGEIVAAFDAVPGFTNALCFSAEGRYLAAGSTPSYQGRYPGGYVVWDLEKGKRIEIPEIPPPGEPEARSNRIAFAPGSRAVATLHPGMVVVRALPSGEALYRLPVERATCIASAPDDTVLAIGSESPERPGVALLDWSNGAKRGFLAHDHPVRYVGFAGRGFLLTGAVHVLTVWDWRRGERTGEIHGSSTLLDLAVLPGREVVATVRIVENDALLEFSLIREGGSLEPLRAVSIDNAYGVPGLAASQDGSLLGLAHLDPWVYDVDRVLEPVLTLEPARFAERLAFDPTGDRLFLSRQGGSVEERAADTGAFRRELYAHTDNVWALGVARSVPWLLSGSNDRTVRIWDLAQDREVARLDGHHGTIRDLALDSDERRLAVGSYLKVKVWNLEPLRRGAEAEQIREIDAHDDRVYGVAWLDDATLATCGSDGRFRLWDAGSFERVFEREIDDAGLIDLAVSEDRSFLAVTTGGGRVLLWRRGDLAAGKPPRTVARDLKLPGALAFSPDGRRLVTSELRDRTLRIYETLGGGELARLRHRHSSALHAIAFSRDGRSLATAGSLYLRVWKTDAGESRGGWWSLAGRDPARYRDLEPEFADTAGQPVEDDVSWRPALEDGLSSASGSRCVAAGDFDRDGDADLLVAADLGDRLLENDGAGRFTLRYSGSIAGRGNSDGIAWVDLDGEGPFELAAVSTSDVTGLFRFQGGHFEAFFTTPGDGCALADLDRDGRLDLVTDQTLARRTFLRSTGDSFEEAALDGWPAVTEGARVSWIDLDVDGDFDAFVHRRDGPRHLLENLGGLAFRERPLGALKGTRGIYPAWTDLDGDQRLDAYVGTWIGPDFVLRGTSEFTFERVHVTVRQPGTSSRRAAVADYDLDGDVDLFVPVDDGKSWLLRNDGGELVDVTTGTLAEIGSATSATFEDFDGDGDPDLFVTRFDAPSLLLWNDLTPGRHWLAVDLEGTRSNPAGVGATVLLKTGAKTQMRQVTVEPGGSSLRLHFGLGAAERVDALEIRWPSGTRQVLRDLEVDRRIVVREAEGGTE